MPDMTTWFLLLFAGTTTLLMALSVPMIRGQVRPNSIYGVRTAKTLGDESAWYRGNAYGGRLLFRAGLVGLISAVTFYFVPDLRANFVAYNLACGAVIVGGLLLSSVLTLRHLRGL